MVDFSMELLLFCILLIIILIFVLKSASKKKQRINELERLKKDELKEYFKEESKRYQRELNLEKDNARIKAEAELVGIQNKINNFQGVLQEKEKRYMEVNQDLDLYRRGKIEEIDKAAKSEEQRQKLLVDRSVDVYRDLQIDKANEILSELLEIKKSKEKEIEEIQNELEVERSKRAAINEEILRQRALNEQQDFYRIQIKEEDIKDIEILRSIVPRLRHPEAINKVIWTAYYQKPLAELRKREAVEGSGVYKITRIKTGEIYIGQAVNISTRWTEHVKSALGVGTLASSQLHRVMKEDGPENFTWEVLEEVSKDKLKERESFYIDFYDSKTYGLNTVSGKKN